MEAFSLRWPAPNSYGDFPQKVIDTVVKSGKVETEFVTHSGKAFGLRKQSSAPGKRRLPGCRPCRQPITGRRRIFQGRDHSWIQDEFNFEILARKWKHARTNERTFVRDPGCCAESTFASSWKLCPGVSWAMKLTRSFTSATGLLTVVTPLAPFRARACGGGAHAAYCSCRLLF